MGAHERDRGEEGDDFQMRSGRACRGLDLGDVPGIGRRLPGELDPDEIHTPGIFAWARNGYKFPRDRKQMTNVIASTYNLTPAIAKGLLSGSLPYEIVDDAVVFQAVEGTYRKA